MTKSTIPPFEQFRSPGLWTDHYTGKPGHSYKFDNIFWRAAEKKQVTRAAASCWAKRARSASSAAWKSKFTNPWAKSINLGSPCGCALSIPEILWISGVILPWHTRKAASKALIYTMTRSLILARNWLWQWVASQRTRDNLLEYTELHPWALLSCLWASGLSITSVYCNLFLHRLFVELHHLYNLYHSEPRKPSLASARSSWSVPTAKSWHTATQHGDTTKQVHSGHPDNLINASDPSCQGIKFDLLLAFWDHCGDLQRSQKMASW